MVNMSYVPIALPTTKKAPCLDSHNLTATIWPDKEITLSSHEYMKNGWTQQLVS